MKPLFVAIALLAILLGINVCVVTSKPATPQHPSVVMEVLDDSLLWCSDEWQAEIGRRFPNAVGLLMHGGNAVEDEWIVSASVKPGHASRVKEIVEKYQARHPGRVVVLLACNPGHLKLGLPGVYYFTDSVWCLPDRSLKPSTESSKATQVISGEIVGGWRGFFEAPQTEKTRWQLEPGVAGNIFEAIRE